MNDRFAKVSKFFPNSYGIRQNAALALLIKILDVSNGSFLRNNRPVTSYPKITYRLTKIIGFVQFVSHKANVKIND